MAAALGRFPWPVYQCVVPLLKGVVEEGARRTALGEMSPPAGAALLDAALASAATLSPRIGGELEAAAAAWAAQGRLAAGHTILRFPGGERPAAARRG